MEKGIGEREEGWGKRGIGEREEGSGKRGIWEREERGGKREDWTCEKGGDEVEIASNVFSYHVLLLCYHMRCQLYKKNLKLMLDMTEY